MTGRRRFWLLLLAGLVGLLAANCRAGPGAVTPTPTKTRTVPGLLSATPVARITDTPTPQPTASPVPSATPSPPPLPTETGVPTDTPAPLPTDTPLPLPSHTPLPPPPTRTAPASSPPPTASATAVSGPPLAPQQGGEWDMEAGFVPGISPLGEECPGWAVAVGWLVFLAPGNPASSCLNENKNMANVYSGERSQEITFDFVSAQAGILRQAQTIPGHRYQIEAWGKHVRSRSPVELSLGVDLTGGQDWQATTVMWHPWDETEEEVWVHSQVVVRANGTSLTIFLKGYHPFAAQGGATLFDAVRVVDLGL
jgi:hypothetical protein